MKRKKVLFAVCGIGLGHTMRSLEIMSALAEDNAVFATSAGKAYSFIEKEKPSAVKTIAALQTVKLYSGKGTLDLIGTAYRNLPKLPAIIRRNWKIFDKFKKDQLVVISDNEVTSLLWAKANRKKIINICHTYGMYFTNFGKLERPLDLAYSFPIDLLSTTEITVNTHFFLPKIRKFLKVWFFGPIIPKDILAAKAEDGEKIVVYLPTKMLGDFIKVAKQTKHKFVVFYDSDHEKLKKEAGRNFSFTKINRKRFVSELSKAKCFVSHGGLSGLTEALFLGKPCYVIADESFHERYYNGKAMELLGYGKCSKIESEQDFNAFLQDLWKYKDALKEKPIRPANREIISFIKRQLV